MDQKTAHAIRDAVPNMSVPVKKESDPYFTLKIDGGDVIGMILGAAGIWLTAETLVSKNPISGVFAVAFVAIGVWFSRSLKGQ